jgi:hypothetical protein
MVPGVDAPGNDILAAFAPDSGPGNAAKAGGQGRQVLEGPEGGKA